VVDAKDNHGVTPLRIACRLGEREMALLLVEHGANLYESDNYNRFPLQECHVRTFADELTQKVRCSLVLIRGSHGAL
jgi:ankyrin repeat protein